MPQVTTVDGSRKKLMADEREANKPIAPVCSGPNREVLCSVRSIQARSIPLRFRPGRTVVRLGPVSRGKINHNGSVQSDSILVR